MLTLTSHKYLPVTAFSRVVLFVVIVLVFLASIQLFILSEQTDRYFAWTIVPPLTAAFIGALLGGIWIEIILDQLLGLPMDVMVTENLDKTIWLVSA
jgi:hypothetical protein